MINKMLVMIKEILSDKDLINTAINQLYRLVSGPLMLLFIPLYLTQEEQGYWYTFSSVAALAVFADLGFSNIILQFAAHEFAFLNFKEDGTIYGDEVHLHKLADFFRFSVKWLCKVTLIVFPIIVIAGYIFINQKNYENINWIVPWFVYSISSALVFVNSSLLSFFEGCNSVAKVQAIRFKITVLTSITVLTGLFLKTKLFALALSLMIAALLGIFLIYKNYKNLIIQLWKISSITFYSWKNEFLSLIWRYAFTWISNYFIFNLFVPIAFQFYGVIEAGKIGFTIALWGAISSISGTWIVSKIPIINILVEKKIWVEVDSLLSKILTRAIISYVIMGILILVMYTYLRDVVFVLNRLSNYTVVVMLFLCSLLQNNIGALAVYLRAFKEEPLMFISIIEAIGILTSTVYIASNYIIDYMFLGYLAGSMIVFIYTIYKVHCKKRCR